MKSSASDPPTQVPSIRTRLASALAAWSLAWGVIVGTALWLSVSHEVDELLDDTLQSSAELIAAIVKGVPADGALPAVSGLGHPLTRRFAWQVTSSDGVLLLRSARAPQRPWSSLPGFARTGDWRLYGLTLDNGRLLTVAQSAGERHEANIGIALSIIFTTLALGLLGHFWLRSQVRAELRPLGALSEQLAVWNIEADPGLHGLGQATRRELQPVYRSLGLLAQRLATRLANERAFSAHAAHALRTPLAGIDAQLAVALRESPEPLRARLLRAREAALRLQTVVTALIGLFRSGGELRRQPVDVAATVRRLPTPSLEVHVESGASVDADPDLLSAALANLLDNAQRQGASQVRITVGPGHALQLTDDGPGVAEDQRQALQDAIDRQDEGDSIGLGLMLADRVARAHGGRLRLLPAERGFAIALELDGSLPP
jgi:signal transduction histidine kinase